MKLHVIPGSPNSRKVLAVMAHIGLACEPVVHLPAARPPFAPDMIPIDPAGMAPVLEDDGFRLAETNAILCYIADKAGAEALYPRDLKRRAEIHRLLAFELAHYNKALGMLGFELVAKPQFFGLEPDAARVTVGRQDLERFAPVLEALLAGRLYAVGDGPTLADYALGYLADFRDGIGFDWSRFPAINAHLDRVRGLPGWVATAG